MKILFTIENQQYYCLFCQSFYKSYICIFHYSIHKFLIFKKPFNHLTLLLDAIVLVLSQIMNEIYYENIRNELSRSLSYAACFKIGC